MDLELTQTQQLLRDTVQQYLAQEVPFDRIRALEKEHRSDAGLWKAICEQGWLGIAVGESWGGAGGSLVDLGLIVEAVARRAAIVPLLEVGCCAHVLEQHAQSDRARALLTGLLEGQVVLVPALLEDEDRFDVCTTRVDENGRVHGHKSFVDHAEIATHHLVRAHGANGPALVLVETGGADVTSTLLTNVGWTPSSRVVYDGAPGEVLVEGDDALAALETLLQLGRALAAVQIVGSMAQSLDGAVEYAKVREQFGKPIGSFQAVRHHCANMASRVASARLLAFEALSHLDAGHVDARRAAAVAKASASRAAPEVTMLAHQVFGGNGVILENDHYFFTLRARERASAWGTVDECLAVLAEDVRPDLDWL